MTVFATTLFLSAFLLFQVQPIVAKMILPWFGGSSSVWSLCMVFFQAELLLGYAYVHWLSERLTLKRQVIVHCSLLLLTLLTLPMGADPSWKGTTQSDPSWSVLLVLASMVGAPYLLLSTTGPLMQAWYAKTAVVGNDNNLRTYRLYALSNFASMLALISYPIAVEPFLVVSLQASFWTAGYVTFAVTCLFTAALVWRRVPPATTQTTTTQTAEPHPGWRECLLWVGLAAAASILLLAMTRHLTQDIAPVPFLWIMPLCIYLLSFILCFDAPRYYVRSAFLMALPVALFAMDRVIDGGFDVPMLIGLTGAALFVFCMVCHGELVRRRPPVRYLTLFYLMLSIGGALGGVVVGLIAPVAFNAYYELPLGLFLCAALIASVIWKNLRQTWRVLLILALVGYGYRLTAISLEEVNGYTRVLRNFYSQTRVAENEDAKQGLQHMMRHGRVTHGEQWMSDALRREPTAYYCEKSGVGLAIRSLPQTRALKIGVVGLGAGTLAAYGRVGDEIRIYEINDQVLELAQSEFTFLKDSQATIVPVMGDGRLMLEREAPQQFDLLAMDAFSGDSIPTHLLTLEAMKTYFDHLGPQGILAVHITNHYLDMRPVIAAAAQRYGKTAYLFAIEPDESDLHCRSSGWALLLQPGQPLPTALQKAEKLLPRAGFNPWTDGFSNLLGILK